MGVKYDIVHMRDKKKEKVKGVDFWQTKASKKVDFWQTKTSKKGCFLADCK